MKFGAMQSVLGEPLPDAFAVAAELGFDGMEVDWNDPADAREGGSLGPERRESLRAAAIEAGVEIISVAAHFHNRGGLADPEAEKQRMGLEAIREGIRLCQDLHARVLMVPFFGAGDIGGPDGVERLARNLNELAPEAELAKVTIAIEHTLPADQAVALLEGVGSPWIRDYWDMANALFVGYDPIQEIETLGHWLVQVHAKEFDGGNGPVASRAAPRWDGLNKKPFGQGQVPVREVLAALRRVGYDGYVVLETGAFGDHKASARAALDVLRASVV